MTTKKLGRTEHLLAKGRLKEAEASAREMLRTEAQNPQAWLLLGKILAERGENGSAEVAFEKVITLSEDPYEAHVNLSFLLFQRGASEKAIEQTRKALKLRPDDALSLNNYGALLRKKGALTEAVEVLSRSLAIFPNNSSAHTNLGHTLSDLGQHKEAVVHLAKAVEIEPKRALCHHNLLFSLHYVSDVSAEEIAHVHRRYGQVVCGIAPALEPPPARDLDPRRQLRIGYVSSDFKRHSVAFFLEPLLIHRDKSAFWVCAYSSTPDPDEVTVRLREQCDLFRDVSTLDDRALEVQIRQDNIDILIDLSGHTSGNRLGVFVKKPAPIQVTYLGYPNTTGLPTMDYRLTDAWADPEGMTESYHTEQLLRMEGGFLCYQPLTPSPEITSPPCLNGAPPTFGSFNKLAKTSETIIKLWARILAQVPESRLRIKQMYLSHMDSRKSFEQLLAKHGVPLDRVDLVGFVPDLHGHLTTYKEVDVALDTYPYHGTTTTCDALWMGVPVVSLAGLTHVSRVGVSLLTRVGLTDLVAHSEDEYVQIASSLIRNTARLKDLRQNARKRLQESGLTDGPRVTRAFEAALRSAFQKYVNTHPAMPNSNRNESKSLTPPVPNVLDQNGRLLSLPGGIHIVAPSNADQDTGYVLEEQGDWFEDEIHFVRRLVTSGETVIDIGASHGVYALSMAQAVGPAGRVIAFEPSQEVATRLRSSAHANGFGQLNVRQAVISNREGNAILGGNTRTENGIYHEQKEIDASTVSVHVTTLDRVVREERLSEVSFIKLTLEGEEVNAIEGASRLIEECSPLLMFERKRGDAENHGLVETLSKLGHEIYRLIPGLNVLYPHPLGTQTDPYVLNLFAARSKRAESLNQNALLAQFIADKASLEDSATWQDALAYTAFGGRFAFRDPFIGEEPGKVRHRTAIERYALSLRKDLDISTRAFYLRTALQYSLSSIEDPNNLSRLLSLARLAWAWGRRAIAVEALETALVIASSGKARIDEPFIAPCPRYDRVDPGARLVNWTHSAILEQLERLSAYSSYHTSDPAQSMKRLQTLEDLGFQGVEMARRLVLMRRRAVLTKDNQSKE